MKTIAIFGGTGLTGKLVLEKALQNGYKVHALVRNPDKIKVTDSNLTIMQGDVLNPNDVQKTIQGSDLVLSLFGHVKGSPEWLQTNGTKNIIEAMEQSGVEKIISLSGGGLPFPEKDKPRFPDKMIRFIMKIAVPKVLNDAIRHAEVLGKSNLNWMIG